MDVAAWLQELGLERYQQAFRDNEVDARSLPHLTADDLKEMGVMAIGHRRLLLQAIAALQGSGAPAVEAVSERMASSENVGDTAARVSGAERRQLTVLFCDLVGSTALATRLDPEDMGQVIRSYQQSCTDVIKHWDGHLARYLGDGALAYFGYPQAHEDDAERAVRAGLELVDVVGELTTPAGDALKARVGIATGLVVVGDLVGQGAAQEHTVVGETPNLAARLQEIAAPGQVVVADATRRLLGAGFELQNLGRQALKGLAEPVARSQS